MVRNNGKQQCECSRVIFANTYDNLVPELVAERSMGSIPFGGRYRLIDFTLSSMANAGIDNVSVIVRKNYHSLMDHLGAGREWDLTRKRGGLNIVPPFAERSVKLYSGRVDALDSILNWLEAQKERYVILSDSYIAMNFDFNKLIDAHVKSGADVTMVYNRAAIPEVPAVITTPSVWMTMTALLRFCPTTTASVSRTSP